jgi:hypothetical protein
VYNRLIAYDATLYHRPNRYNLECNELRKSIVFFIKDIKHTFISCIGAKIDDIETSLNELMNDVGIEDYEL